MSFDKIIQSWKKKSFQPVYWFEGDESYFIDLLVQEAENNILSSDEAAFNLTTFYGKDADWAAVMNACKRHPMFSERQVVLLKEAQLMNNIDKLESYIESPLSSTIFIVAYKGKTYDKRTKLYKLLEKKATIFQSQKLKEGKIQEWIIEHVTSIGCKITPKSASLLEEHIGSDISRIVNEIDKLRINLKDTNIIDENSIELFIGISKEYNAFELQAAIAQKNLLQAIKIINYFESNPKASPIQMVLPAIYGFMSRVYSAYGLPNKSDASLKPLFYFNPVALQQGHAAMKNYGYQGIEKIILLLHHYSIKGVGVGDDGTSSAKLLKEMVAKIIMEC